MNRKKENDEAGEKTVIEQRRKIFETGEHQWQMMKKAFPQGMADAVAEISKSLPSQDLFTALKDVESQMQSMRRAMDSIKHATQVFSTFAALPVIARASEIGAALRTMEGEQDIGAAIFKSPLFEYFASERFSNLEGLISASGAAEISIEAHCEATIIRAGDFGLDHQIVEELKEGKGFGDLSPKYMERLKLFLRFIIILWGYVASENAVRAELCFLQPKIYPSMTASQAGKRIRNAICEAQMPVEMLRGYKQVKGTGVRLRDSPSMRGAVLDHHLRDRAIMEILDNTDRSWLYVRMVEDGIEGWISRKYVAPLI